ncbi:MAG: hypothetical protein MJ003_03825 [Paludibacteraceae bacterium]|nr:hypothetical protein [Paludibacteraceae bacterium]
MDNLRNVIELLFADRDVEKLLNSMKPTNELRRDKFINIEEFKALFFSKHSHYFSGNQLNSLFDITNDLWSYNRILDFAGRENDYNGSKNVFNILTHLTNEMLVVYGDVPYCKYDEYLRWNQMTKSIGEDMLVTNFLASYDFKNHIDRVDFSWHPYILTTNKNLEYIMSKGLAELHSHLYGSSLVFTLNWLEIMNFPMHNSLNKFKKIKNVKDSYRKLMLAAFLRSVIYKLVNYDTVFDNRIDTVLGAWLEDGDKLRNAIVIRSDVQAFIERLRYGRRKCIDYALPNPPTINQNDVNSRESLIGERLLLYKAFSQIVRGNTTALFDMMLYIYLIIKAQFRHAMIQVNDDIGFENFQYYDEKKATFVSQKPLYDKAYANIAINLAVQNTNVKHIEYRISPWETINKNKETFKWLEEPIKKLQGVEYGLIMHFIKTKQKPFRNPLINGLVCRNADVRNRIRKEAYSIMHLIERGERKIIGIDAANSEFNCRPEVFATIFRKLRYVRHRAYMRYIINLSPFRLGITYHVGEDFCDVIDGLRAIDEAMIFLNLTDGDRIGHGTALGIDTHNFYEEKHFSISMPKQVLLDNMAWLLYKVEKYGITDDSGFLFEAKCKFNELLNEIYGYNYNFQNYLNAWLLRGDEPKLYIGGHYYNNSTMQYAYNDVETVNTARKDEQACELYYRYHYNCTAKNLGDTPTEWTVKTLHKTAFVKVLDKIQEKMQEEVAHKHIAIECNPTSNLRIGNINRYVKHPIVKFYNEGLKLKEGEIKSAAQISVSINTDDAGIFATSLEKEFALMALALEKEPDANGNPRYQQQSVYRWIENVRENAFIRKFESVKNGK